MFFFCDLFLIPRIIQFGMKQGCEKYRGMGRSWGLSVMDCTLTPPENIPAVAHESRTCNLWKEKCCGKQGSAKKVEWRYSFIFWCYLNLRIYIYDSSECGCSGFWNMQLETKCLPRYVYGFWGKLLPVLCWDTVVYKSIIPPTSSRHLFVPLKKTIMSLRQVKICIEVIFSLW